MLYQISSLLHSWSYTTPPELKNLVVTTSPKEKTALLINPFYRKSPYGSYGKHVLTPSLALTSIAAATPSGWKVSFWDENLLQGHPPYNPFPEVVGITVHLTFAKRAYELARWYRTRGAKVVLGGQHVSSCPDEVRPHADAIAIGEGTLTWPQILKDVEENTLKKEYIGSYSSPFREEPSPRRDILPKNSFLTPLSLIATRGCHNRCGFCYLSTKGLKIPYQKRDVSQVAIEFSEGNFPYGVFLDNNLGSDPVYLLSLCNALKPLKKIWSAAVSLDITNHPKIVRQMSLSGCTGVFIGFETLNNENLRTHNKRSPIPDEFERRIDIFRKYGIEVNGSFVVGFDHDTPDTFDVLVRWIENVRLTCATFHILTPYPGTPLFKKLSLEGRILHHNWDLYDTSHAVFKPKLMTPEDLEAGYRYCYERIFSHRSIWKRRPRELAPLYSYLAMTYLYKRSNFLWPYLIRYNLTGLVWRPLIELARWNHLRFRNILEIQRKPCRLPTGVPVSPSV